MPNWTPAKEAAYNSLAQERSEHFAAFTEELDTLFLGTRGYRSLGPYSIPPAHILHKAEETLDILQRFLDQK